MSSPLSAPNGDTGASAEVELLRQELLLLSDRVRTLEVQLAALRLRSPSAPASPSASAPASSSGGGYSGSALSADRLAAAQDIGEWIVRCLNNQQRGLSGRERISQASRLYLVVRDFSGTVRSPPLVLFNWRDTSAIVSPHGQPGDSIYIGLPTKEEARLVLRTAGLSIPPALERA
jgi:hypothetical protein